MLLIPFLSIPKQQFLNQLEVPSTDEIKDDTQPFAETNILSLYKKNVYKKHEDEIRPKLRNIYET